MPLRYCLGIMHFRVNHETPFVLPLAHEVLRHLFQGAGFRRRMHGGLWKQKLNLCWKQKRSIFVGNKKSLPLPSEKGTPRS